MASGDGTIEWIASAQFTLTLAALADAAARQSTMLANTSGKYPAAKLTFRIKSGAAAPTVGRVYEIYLLRGNGTIRDDAAGASDAAITIENAPLLGAIVVTASAAKNFYVVLDTAPLGPLGPDWGIAVKNNSAQALSTTEGDHLYGYEYYYPKVAP